MTHTNIDATNYKKTKIIATIGPATQEKIGDLLAAGVNGIRLNFSHNTHQWHADIAAMVRKQAKVLDRSVAIIQDLPGPKMRLGKLKPGGVEIVAGQILKLQFDAKNDAVLPTQYDFSGHVKKGQDLYLRDGQISTEIQLVSGGVVTVKAKNSGKVLTGHGINLPDTDFEGGILTTKDKLGLDITRKIDADYVAISFVQTVKDIENVRRVLHKHRARAKIIVKIETKAAIANLESVIQASDVVMIARGDLAIEIGPEQVPIVGREIILLARKYKKPIIMATQMMESMMTTITPSRAEANDVATAVSLGVDCLMLSGETAIGQFPVETVQMMKKIILSSERYFVTTATDAGVEKDIGSNVNSSIGEEIGLLERLTQKTRLMFSAQSKPKRKSSGVSSAVAQTSISFAAITLSEQLGAKVILAETRTGSTALSIASLRPGAPMIIISPDQKVCNQCAIVWGGKPYLVARGKHSDIGTLAIIRKLKGRGTVKKGDWVVQAYGQNGGISGGTDTIRLMEVR